MLNAAYQGFLRRLARWRAGMPGVRFLILAALLVAFGQWASYMGGLVGLKELCRQIVADLGVLQPFSLLSIFDKHLGVCGMVQDAIGFYRSECNWVRLINPSSIIPALFATLAEVWQTSGVPGRIILPLSMVSGFALSLIALGEMYKKGEGGNYVHFLFSALLTPFAASLIALILKLLAIAIFWVFGALIGLILWVLVTFGSLLAVWKTARAVHDGARTLESSTGTIIGTAVRGKDRDPKA